MKEEDKYRSLDCTELCTPAEDILAWLGKGRGGKGSGLKLKPSTVLSSKLWVPINTEEVPGYHQRHKES